MSYIKDITEPLIKTLTHTGGLPVRQLAGHAANLEFWVAEVAHAFHVIDGYSHRFQNIQQGERDYADPPEEKGLRAGFAYHSGPPMKRGMKDQGLKDLRRRLADAMDHVLGRCCLADLISEQQLDQAGEKLGFDVREIKREKAKIAT